MSKDGCRSQAHDTLEGLKRTTLVLLFLVFSISASAETLVAVHHSTLVQVEPSSSSSRILMHLPGDLSFRIVAQDRIRNRLYLEAFESVAAPMYFGLWTADLRSGQLTKSRFRASEMHDYFFDEQESDLYAHGRFAGERQVRKIDLQTGSTSQVLTIGDFGVWADAWHFASYDQDLNRLYLTGVLSVHAEFSEKALFVVDLRGGVVTETPFRSWDLLRFLPRSHEGFLYVHVARGTSSEVQEIVRIDPSSGTSATVIAGLPLRLMPPVADALERGIVFLRAHDDGQLFIADFSRQRVIQQNFRDAAVLLYAPHPAAAGAFNIPTVSVMALLVILIGLAAVGSVALHEA